MSVFVVVGAGPVGRATARILAKDGHEVRLVSRSGTAPDGAVAAFALDARDADGLARIGAGAEAIFMCAMAPYTRWPTDFPPIMEGVAEAAQKLQARLVVLGNVYGYGSEAKSPLTSSAPLAPTSVKGRVRVAMWDRARSARVPALEVRASDYLGEGAGSLFTLMTLPSLLAGKPAMVSGDLDARHAWTFTRDVARTLVAASRYTGEWGRAFLVPSQHSSVRSLAARFSELAGAPAPDLQMLTEQELEAMGRDDELMRELPEMGYLYRSPCIIEASDTERLLGISASSLDTMIMDTLRKD
ncbi:NAD-dependent epimerase/dehydratase family protein [Mesorhizobium sp. GbtcB19]|uniref:NAD-dependent epimerase/dehydratase family protein n=1 Tax=Mesorhizobium sp. GbtcB19 TaxID=2824764 RepID=UPI001C2F94EB|nr:NAD-dependent epimerase/dehydratase family protein [Mesorhizobium sp. GbtcB19]